MQPPSTRPEECQTAKQENSWLAVSGVAHADAGQVVVHEPLSGKTTQQTLH
jgi:hypothetical protein